MNLRVLPSLAIYREHRASGPARPPDADRWYLVADSHDEHGINDIADARASRRPVYTETHVHRGLGLVATLSAAPWRKLLDVRRLDAEPVDDVEIAAALTLIPDCDGAELWCRADGSVVIDWQAPAKDAQRHA